MTNVRSQSGFTFIDLFAGVGGFHHALGRLGGECVQAVELDEEARHVYRASFPTMDDHQIVADIRSLTRTSAHPEADELDPDEVRARVPAHDVLCAGFPCQPFSKSGFQKGVRDRTRGTLFYDVMSIVLAREPQFVLLENVRNLAGPRHVDTWATIIESLREAGYSVADEPVVMSPHLLAQDMGGAPQSRDRVFILAHRLPAGAPEELRSGDLLARREPTRGFDPDSWDIRSILDEDTPLDSYGLRPQERTWLDAWQAFVQEIPDDTLPGFPVWVDAFELRAQPASSVPAWKADFLRKNSHFYEMHKHRIDSWLKKRWGPTKQTVAEFPPSRRKLEWQARKAQPAARDRDLEGLVAHLRPSGIRVKPASYLPALVAITQTSVLGPKVTGTDWRRISPREAARLQGIPFDGFVAAGASDKAIYKQLGNAVNVGVVEHLASLLFAEGGAPWASALEATG
jgi:DNA (cytosine-5)-methyltransferase 1